MTSRSPASGESERDRDRDRERELATASRSLDSGERERGGDEEKERLRWMLDFSSVSYWDAKNRGILSSWSPDYLSVSYWDARYRNNKSTYDWYVNYPNLVSLFGLYLRLDHRILSIGCGNSSLGADMVDDGYQDVVNIDISSVLIETMQAKYVDKPALKYITMDVRDMSPFESASFDAVIDKGTLDISTCGEDGIAEVLKEVERVLKDKGAYILITYHGPNHRVDLLRSIEQWNIKLHLLEKVRSSLQESWALSAPRPLERAGSWVTQTLARNLDGFYVYVCIKDESLSAKQATDTETSSSQKDT